MTEQATQRPHSTIVILMIGTFIALLNNTLLNIALPSMMADLHVEATTIQWLATGYMLVMGILVPTTAFSIQKFSARHLFLVAMSVFSIGAIVAGFAHTFPILLAGRLLQAGGSSIMMPLLMNVMLVSYPAEKRGTAMGYFGMIMMGAPAIGPTLSGWIIQHYDWRMLFHFITPIAIAGLIAGFIVLKDKKPKNDLTLDVFSVLLSSLGFGGILYGFSSAGSKGWGSPHVVIALAVGIIALALFAPRQLKSERPMLNLRIFRYPMYTLSACVSIVISIVMFSAMLLLPMYVQTLRGISPLESGLLLLPGALIMALSSPFIGKLFDKFGGRILAVTGLSVIVVTSYLFSQLTLETSQSELILIYALRMLGMSLVMTPVMTNGLNHLPARVYPHGTAMNSTLQQLSGAMGSSILITMMSNRATSSAQEITADFMLNGVEITPQLLQQISLQAMLKGINFSFFITVFIALIALVLAFFMKRANKDGS
ncbi:MAG: DHA2 family efflux MFS transporter permease subunit [Peptococcaceae bacterium]|nr:DHA2 family efflux MFS transporter permease subunit [Peptococcaceae bacterium]